MGLNVGTLYATIELDSSKLERQLGNTQQQLQRTGSFIGGALTTGAKLAVGAIGTVGAAIGAIATQGGISRALSIEDARAKLAGLGNDTATVEEIMQNALAAVKGTAFGLGDAATVAASAVAAGIKPGKDLERVLGLVGDAATIAGTDMSSMGSIFNKVAATGKLQGDVIQQLGDAGVPILQMVANELGVTAEEAAKMASAGKVNFETFANAMENGLGGAALKSGDTFRGAMANIRASLGRLGAGFFTPLLNAARDLAPGLIGLFDAIGTKLGPVFERMGQSMTSFVPQVISALERITGWITAAQGVKLPNFGAPALITVIGGLIGTLGPLTEGIPFVGRALSGLTGPVGLVLGLFSALVAASPELREAIGFAFQQVAVAVGSLITALAPVIEQLGTLLPIAGAALGAALTVVVGVITSVVQAFSWVVGLFTQTEGGAQLLAGIIAGVLVPALVMMAGTAAVSAAQTVAAWGAQTLAAAKTAAQVVMTGTTVIAQWVASGAAAVANAARHVAAWVLMGTQALINGARIAAGWVMAMGPVGWVITTIVALVALIVANWDNIVKFTTEAWSNISNFISTVWNNIVSWVDGAINNVRNTIVNILTGIVSFWIGAWNNVTNFLGNAWNAIVNGVSSGIGNVLNFFANLPGNIGNFLAGLPGQLLNIGMDMIRGLGEGIASMGQWVLDQIGGVINGAVDWAKGLLGINSPSRVFRQFGLYTGEGFAQGINAMAPAVDKAVTAMLDQGWEEPSFTADLQAVGRDLSMRTQGLSNSAVSLTGINAPTPAAQPANVGPVVNQTNNIYNPVTETLTERNAKNNRDANLALAI